MLAHVAVVAVGDDEGKGVDQRKDVHCPADPAVKDVEFFVGDAGQHGDGVFLCAKDAGDVNWLEEGMGRRVDSQHER